MNSNKISLLVLAAGMGSRYGGLKQLDEFGPNGETIIDYSIYDALQAGFNKIVFVIRNSFYEQFKTRIESRWSGKVELVYVFQELDHLPDPFVCPQERTKPWGTGHAVWVAHEVIKEPFGVINADDYYGREALQTLFNFLNNKENIDHYSVIAYLLNNTLSEHGAVNRGVCKLDHNSNLKSIEECKGIQKDDAGKIYYTKNNTQFFLETTTPVSMNMWGFQASYFDYAEKLFSEFLKQRIEEESSEFYIPELVQYLIDHNILNVKAIESNSNWFGVTYKEDKPFVQDSIQAMISNGYYPEHLV
ncbi:MAG TPA: sugar phosphate nucleotidyltransferase [Saprospiraceae bacterium]|nr:sugar phosphate nucleotidyltransferase [Saprospiraceae bacterium]